MSIKILLTDHFASEAAALLQTELDCEIKRSTNPDLKAEELADFDCLIVRSRTKVTAKLIEAAPKLRCIVTATSGFEHIDFEACKQRNIAVGYTPNANIESTAQLTMSLLLVWARRLNHALTAVEKNHWRSDDLRGHTLNDEILGVIGYGRIGQRVAELAQAFNMQVYVYDPYVESEKISAGKVKQLGLSELLVVADYLTFHVPLTKETKNLLNRPTLGVINPEACIINTSRGGVVDENELALALIEKRLRGAALDVFDREPLIKESLLRQCKNLLMTPHIGGFTHEALLKASQSAAQEAINFFKKGQLSTPLPEHLPWFKQILWRT